MRSGGSTQEDYLLRIIRQAGEALRRLRHRLIGGADAPEVVRIDAAAAIDALLGPRSPILNRLDALSAVTMIGHPAYVQVWAALLDVEAGAADAVGDAAAAARGRAHANALRAAAESVWGSAPESTGEEMTKPH